MGSRDFVINDVRHVYNSDLSKMSLECRTAYLELVRTVLSLLKYKKHQLSNDCFLMMSDTNVFMFEGEKFSCLIGVDF